MLKIEKVSKIFQDRIVALDQISLTIEQGDIYGIIGLSGAGKSTLIRMINGLETPSSGAVYIENQQVNTCGKKELRDLRKRIGMIFQSFNLFSSKTVYENVVFPLRLERLNNEEMQKRVHEMLDLVGVYDKKNQYPHELSGGQKQRVAIARALVSHPEILLLDEATSALDPATSNLILELIKGLKKKLSLTVVLITHDMDVVKKICNRVAILEGGKLIDEGDIVSIFKSPSLKRVYHKGEIPKGIVTGKILSLTFDDSSAKKPIISKLIQEESVEVNILIGNIEYINEQSMGTLVVEVQQKDLQKSVEYLRNAGVEVEVIA